jgi:hypothetical protein
MHDFTADSKLSPDRLVYRKGDPLMLLAPVKYLPTRWLAMDRHDNVGSKCKRESMVHIFTHSQVLS